MRLPRIETTLAAVLLLATAPFALAQTAAPPPANTPGANTPGETTPVTPPGAACPGTMSQRATTPGAAPSTRAQSQEMGGATSASGWNGRQMSTRSAERVPKADLEAAQRAKVSLTDAINTAQERDHGDVVSARFELHQGKPEYLIKTFDGKKRQEWLGHIDAKTGKLIGRGRTIPLNRLPREDQRELTASRTAGTTLAQAVQTAEQERGGKALAAGLSARNGKVAYRAELLKNNGRTQMAMISPKSGAVSGRYR